MDELKELVEEKIKVYNGLYNIAKELNQEGNIRYYAECVGKFNEILTIIDRV